MGEDGFQHGMTPAQLKKIRRLEKENEILKKLLAEKKLEGRLNTDFHVYKYTLTFQEDDSPFLGQ